MSSASPRARGLLESAPAPSSSNAAAAAADPGPLTALAILGVVGAGIGVALLRRACRRGRGGGGGGSALLAWVHALGFVASFLAVFLYVALDTVGVQASWLLVVLAACLVLWAAGVVCAVLSYRHQRRARGYEMTADPMDTSVSGLDDGL